MAVPRIPLRIGVVQMNPKIGQVKANLEKARELCRKLKPNTLDLLCFPEMAFTGYVFESAASIRPYLEKPHVGPTSQFCSELAKQLRCHVVAGYPEELTQAEIDCAETKERDECVSGAPSIREVVGANSAVIYGPEGELVSVYRKTNLFQTDMTWATPGTGFLSITLPSPLRNVTLGICMDLNAQPPAKWDIIDGPYEIASHALEHKSNLVVLLNAWLLSDDDRVEQDPVGREDAEEGEQQYAWTTLNFWAARLRPLWDSKLPRSSILTKEEEVSLNKGAVDEDDSETVVVVCNRFGTENDREFAGSSAVFSMKRSKEKPVLLDMMGITEEGVRVWNLLV